MELVVSQKIKNKLRDKHSVTIREVYECISNIDGELFEDTAEEHKTTPPSVWFIAPTDRGRMLKVVIVPVPEEGKIYLKTAFDAKPKHIQLYNDLNA